MKAQTNCFNSFIHHTDFRLIQSVIMTTNSIILLLVLYTSCLCSTRDVYVQPSEGEHCRDTPCYNISTFGRIARNNFSNSSGLVVHFLEGTHLLDLQELVVFTNLTNATFEGDGKMEQGFQETVWQSTVVIKCTEHSSTGIAFVDSYNITFRYITITNCGADMTTNLGNYLNVSLGFLNVGNGVVIDHLSIQNGSGSGLIVISDGVDLSIATSSFAHNGYVNNCDYGEACNVLILYIDPHSCGNPQKHVYHTFITNTNVSQVQSHHSRLPSSIGLGVGFLQASYSVTVILDSVMVYNNGNTGIIIYTINVPNYNLTINNSHSSDADGFALYVKTSSENCRILENNKCCHNNTKNNIINIFIINSQFIYNKGPCYFFFQGIYHPVNITIKSTEFSHNMVTSDSMLHFSSYAYQEKVRIVLQNVTINNNTFSWSKNDIRYNTSLLQPSALHAEFVDLVLNKVKIINNNATGLLCYRTVVLVNRNSTSVFHNNTGIDGGGLAMYSDSYILFEENSVLNFTKNKAKERGGAIFIHTILPESPCFYQYTEGTRSQSTKAFFFGNNANTAGTAIFGGDMHCLLFTNPRNYSIAGDCFYETFEYSTQTGPSVISSEPTDVCFCDDNNTINCSQTQLTMTAYPGEEINISVVTVGQLDGIAPGLIKIQPRGNTTAPVMINSTIPMNCTTILFTPTAYDNYSLAVLVSSIEINIEKIHCPLGFQTSNKTGSCECIKIKQKASSYNLNIKCYAANNKISRKGDAWIGNISDCVIVQTPCPFDYCNLTQTKRFSFADPDPQCALNRKGVLCGGCRDNFSLVLGSNKCKNCTDSFHLALIIPFAAAGFGLVALLMVLNLTVSIGTINGLIFYASIVKIGESTGVFFPNGLIPVLSQFIAWLNLDLGIETCFYQGMKAYTKCGCSLCFHSTYGSS